MQRYWQLLGLAPTGDPLAIKRAYAKQLKTTRPDDDAQAYQGLREAYDWALDWARRQGALQAPPVGPEVHTDAALPAPEASACAATPELAAAPAPAERVEAPVEPESAPADDGLFVQSLNDPVAPAQVHPVDDGLSDRTTDPAPSLAAADGDYGADTSAEAEPIDPSELAHSVLDFWRQQGDSALIAAWPRLHYAIDGVPLIERSRASACFAQLVLEVRGFPPEVVEQLADYFQWGRDYRVDADLGSELARPLETKLRELGLLRTTDPKVLAYFAHDLHVHRCLHAGQRLRALLYSALAPAPCVAHRDLPLATPRGLGLTPDDRDLLLKFNDQVQALRFAALCLLLGALLRSGMDGDWMFDLIPSWLMSCSIVLAALVVGLISSRREIYFEGLAAEFPTLRQRPGLGRLGVALTLPLLACSLAAWLTGQNAANGLMSLPISAIGCMAAMALVWVPSCAWNALLVPLAVVIAGACWTLLGPSGGRDWAPAIGSIWVILAHWLLLTRNTEVIKVYSAPWRRLLPSSLLGWVWLVLFSHGIAAVLLMGLALATPLTCLVHSQRIGSYFALATLGVAIALDQAFPAVAPLLAWVLIAPIGMGLLQGAATWWSRLPWFTREPRGG